MKKKLLITIAILCCVLTLFTACGNSAPAETPKEPAAPAAPAAPAEPQAPADAPEAEVDPYAAAKDFYKGTDLEIIVPLGAGGGMDVAARNAAPFLQELLGAKSVTVTNMTGASGIVAYNWMYTEADRDGSVIAFGSPPCNNAIVQNDPACVYVSEEFCYLGTVQHTTFALTVHPDSPYADIDAFLATDDFTIGSFAYNDSTSLYGAITCEIMNKSGGAVVGGYGKASNVLLAMAQGEVDAYTCPMDSLYRYVEGEQCVPIMVYSKERDPYWPDVPTVYELFDVTEEQQLYLETVPESDRMIFAPPEVPQDRVDFLAHCISIMLADPQFEQLTIESTGYFSGTKTAEETRQQCLDVIANFDNYRVLDNLISKHMK